MPSTTTLQIRPAALREARQIAELHNASMREAFRTLMPNVPHAPVSVVPLEQRQAYWREAIEFAEPQVLVAVEGDSVIGFVGFDRSRDKGTPPTMGEIWAIYVNASHWSTDVGLALWDAAREGLLDEGCAQVSVWVPLANDRAMRFFELAGLKRELPSAKTMDVGGVKIEEIRLKRVL
ncbi:MAG: GNAT family N-acetyltransferase [Rhodoferax sp.]|nr:GNAT family N-acetyltransferase [Rhodoferax sp.]